MSSKPLACRWPRRLQSLAAAAGLASLGLAASTGRADILYATQSDNSLVKIASGGTETVFANSNLAYSIAITFDRAGNLYAGNTGAIIKFTPSGSASTFANTSQGVNAVAGMAFDAAGNLFVVNSNVDNIIKITPAGTSSVFADASSGLVDPAGLAFDSAGNLFVADYYRNKVLKFTPGGAASVFAGTGQNPTGLAFDRAGNLFVANRFDNTITEVTPNGTASLFASAGLDSPLNLAFDSAGNLYAANQAGHDVEEFDPGGKGRVFFGTGVDDPLALAFTNDAGVPLPLANAVPEPSAWALLLAGLVVGGLRKAVRLGRGCRRQTA